MNEGGDWKDFKELVTWATWEVIKAIASGEKLERTMHYIIATARSSTFKEKK